MIILIFSMLVIAMALLTMYKKEKNALRRMMARGRCGLPGLPNLTFNTPPNPMGGYDPDDNDDDDNGKKKMKDPFDSQLKTLSKIIVEKRKQISDSKGRVNKAEEAMRNLHFTSITLRKKYLDIMDDLKGELESAEIECQALNKYIGKANELKQKFFSPEDDDLCGDSRALPGLPKRVTREQWGSLPLCNNNPPKQPKYSCHPPIQKPCGQSSPMSCKCPSGSRNPLSTCMPPLPTCCPKKSQSKCGSVQTNSSSQQSVGQYRSDPSVGSCCNPPQPSSKPNSLPCPPPLPSLMPKKLSSKCSATSNSPFSDTESSCCPTNDECSPPPVTQSSKEHMCPPPRTRSRCCPPPRPCPPPECMCECPEEEPPRTVPAFVRKPPFSSFFQERLPTQPIQRRSFKQTVVTEECIEGDDNETSSWLEPNTIVTEVRTSSVSFPPNCCLSTYEEFLNAALQARPKPEIKLPVIVDECDPCAEIPREISPWEDVENVTHTCGTQTQDDVKEDIKNKKKC